MLSDLPLCLDESWDGRTDTLRLWAPPLVFQAGVDLSVPTSTQATADRAWPTLSPVLFPLRITRPIPALSSFFVKTEFCYVDQAGLSQVLKE